MNRLSLTHAMLAASNHYPHPTESLNPGPARGFADAGPCQYAHVYGNFYPVGPALKFVSQSYTKSGSKYALHMKRRLFPIRSKLYLFSVCGIPSSQCGSINSVREDAADPLVFPGKCIGSIALCIAAGKPPALQLERSRCAAAQRWSR